MRDPEGPVGDLMREIAIQLAALATAKAPVRKIPDRWHTGRTSDARPPGYLKSHITTAFGHATTYGDILFGGANAPEDPGTFLELPAEQMHSKHPFLTTALDSIFID